MCGLQRAHGAPWSPGDMWVQIKILHPLQIKVLYAIGLLQWDYNFENPTQQCWGSDSPPLAQSSLYGQKQTLCVAWHRLVGLQHLGVHRDGALPKAPNTASGSPQCTPPPNCQHQKGHNEDSGHLNGCYTGELPCMCCPGLVPVIPAPCQRLRGWRASNQCPASGRCQSLHCVGVIQTRVGWTG